ncbi:phage terminase large subunit family protein, partial [Klebsiella pneumoniae]|uniref:phage terminase large subunit family protein n=1 Tax=Klebsiella pneumoniae TaxID=573 RepID=UPI003B987BDD
QLAGRDYRGVVFVGPARTGKTFSLVHGAISYAVTAGAGDLMVVQTSQDSARDFSRTEVDRVLRHSPELAARMSTRARDDSTHEKYTRAGNVVKIGW